MFSGLRFVSREEVISDGQQKKEHAAADARPSRKHQQGGHRKEKPRKKQSLHYVNSSSSGGSEENQHKGHSREKPWKKRKVKLSKYSSDSEDVGSSDSKNTGIHDYGHHRKDKSRKRQRGCHSDPSFGIHVESDKLDSQASDMSDGMSDEGVSGRKDPQTNRKEAGLEWMLKAPGHTTAPTTEPSNVTAHVVDEKESIPNPKELNPYLKDGGDGYPLEVEKGCPKNKGGSSLPQRAVIGDGGVSWRLKALKRAKEQAEREGRKLNEVVEERWGSLAEMTTTVLARRAAHANAHLHAIRDRKRDIDNAKPRREDEGSQGTMAEEGGVEKTVQLDDDDQQIKTNRREYLKGVTVTDSRMNPPQSNDSLSWKRNKRGEAQSMRPADAEIVRAAASALNRFENDGSFWDKFKKDHKLLPESPALSGEMPESPAVSGGMPESPALSGERDEQSQAVHEALTEYTTRKVCSTVIEIQGLSANQLAAKAMQLRLRGKNKEADEVLIQVEKMKEEREIVAKRASQEYLQDRAPRLDGHDARIPGLSLKSITAEHERRSGKDDGDSQIATGILSNRRYNTYSCVDDEYDFGTSFDDSKDRKKNKSSNHKGGNSSLQAISDYKRIVTQQERCQFCFDNPSRPKHLTISIGNSCYLMLPPKEPLAEGHCYIVPMQHEGSSRNIDENAWEELRNFKKCLLKMFADQDKDAIFMETAMGLMRQRRHCLVECIPLPHQVAKQAPLYFKKAIEEAEDEWSQHNAKKLIDTSVKGLRGSIPKNFPYFHVEFGLHAGYVHVIDNEKTFNSHLGRNVVVGMLKLPEEEMYRRRRHESFEHQRKAVIEFQKFWDPFDWTKVLD